MSVELLISTLTEKIRTSIYQGIGKIIVSGEAPAGTLLATCHKALMKFLEEEVFKKAKRPLTEEQKSAMIRRLSQNKQALEIIGRAYSKTERELAERAYGRCLFSS